MLVYRDARRTLQVKVWLNYASMIINLIFRVSGTTYVVPATRYMVHVPVTRY